MNNKPAIGIATAIAVLGLVALASDSDLTQKPAAVNAAEYADFMDGEVLDVQDLAEGAEIQRRFFNRITPPGISLLQPMFPPVAPFDATNFDDSFLDELLGEDKNSVAVYPLSLVLDPKTRETLIYNAEGKFIAAVPADGVSRIWPEEADPARVTLQLDLLPSEDVEPYLYVEDRIAESCAIKSAKSPRTGDLAMRSLSGSQFGIANIQRLTNGNVRLTVTNGTDVAEVFSYTVWYTSSVSVVAWTNEESNVVTDTNTLWTPVSPSFNGLESMWECQMTNLVLTNSAAVWEDANISSNDRVRFYGAANRMDTDEDGLTDGAEKFVYHTDPGEEDTDSDGLPDGWEVHNGLDPLDETGANGSEGDLDEDGFDNALELELGAPPNNPAWNGEELAYRLTHAHPRTRSITNDLIGLHVDIDKSLDCGGTNGGVQNRTDDLNVPALLDYGYYIDIAVEGSVEDVDTNYDKVYFEAVTNTFYFMGHDGIPDDGTPETCQMVGEGATRNNFIVANSTVRLRYDTVGHKWHDGAYAEIIDAELTGVLNVDLSTNLWWFAGENPGGGYEIQAPLTAAPVTTGTFKWDVTAGTSIVDLNNGGADADSITATDDNSVTVKSTGASSSIGDVTIAFTYNGVAVCSYDLTVRKPGTPQLLTGFPTDAPWMLGYITTYRFKVLDQFGADVPFDMPVNESFGTWTSDLWYELWPDPTPNGTSTQPYLGIAHQFKDEYGASQLVPSSVDPSDPAAGEPVQHATQYYRAGSLTPGAGILIKQHTVQMFRGYSRQQ